MSQQYPNNSSEPQPPSDSTRPNRDYTNASVPDNAQVQAKEAARLSREQKKIAMAQQKRLFDRIENSIYFLVGMLETLLLIRFFLRLTGANPDNMFARFIYNLSEPFVSPFSTLFISPTANTSATIGQNIFDVNLVIAIIIYCLLGFLATWLVRYVYRQVSP
ncbi:MAG: YggT family protein [Limnothrix sp. RL_2_0]|nr:YggT family protein [Limnothrix sp. RL_2_0]